MYPGDENHPKGFPKFPRMKFEESMAKYGNDKPDLRFGMEHTDITKIIVEHDGGAFLLGADCQEVQGRHLP